VIGLELYRLIGVGQRLCIIFLQERRLSPPHVGAFIFRRQLDGLGKVGGCFCPFFQRDIRKAAILIKRRLFGICFDCSRKLLQCLFVLLAFKKLVTLCVIVHSRSAFLLCGRKTGHAEKSSGGGKFRDSTRDHNSFFSSDLLFGRFIVSKRAN